MSLPEPKRCLDCGYILDGLPEPRCPECGRPFDIGNPATYVFVTESGRGHLWLALGGVAAMVSPTVVARVGTALGQAQSSAQLAASLAAFGGIMLEIAVFGGSLSELRRPLGARSRQRLLAAAIISGVSVVAGVVACCGFRRLLF